MTRAGAPLDALPRRFPYGVGPRFLRRQAPPSASSWQEDIASGRSPDAARAPADEAGYPGAAPAKARISPGARRRIEDLFSGPASGLLRHQDAS